MFSAFRVSKGIGAYDLQAKAVDLQAKAVAQQQHRYVEQQQSRASGSTVVRNSNRRGQNSSRAAQ
jgi:hypothetical protein